MNVPAIVSKINELTSDFSGVKVPVKVIVDIGTKEFEVEVGIPPTVALIVKELGVEKGSGNPKEEKIGNLTLEQVKKIARIKLGQSYAKTLKSAALEVLGTCVSMGVTVEGKDPKEVQKEMREGVHDEFFREET